MNARLIPLSKEHPTESLTEWKVKCKAYEFISLEKICAGTGEKHKRLE